MLVLFNAPAPPEIYTLSLHDALPILYAGDTAYTHEDLAVDGPRHRLYMVDDQLDYIRD